MQKNVARYPNFHTPATRHVVLGFAPNCACSSVKYALPPINTTHNLIEFRIEMRVKSYLASWWARTI